MKESKKARMYRQIEEHGANLNKIFHTKYTAVDLCKKLRRLELKTHKLAEDYCNGIVETAEYELLSEKILISVDKIINFSTPDIPVFLNGDPRGYALKIRDSWMEENAVKLHTDWGGYGILSPDFDGN